jgi:hypothetical protein
MMTISIVHKNVSLGMINGTGNARYFSSFLFLENSGHIGPPLPFHLILEFVIKILLEKNKSPFDKARRKTDRIIKG